MARNKKGQSTPRGAKGGRSSRGGRGGSRGQARFATAPSFIPQTGGHIGFTLADEARQTSQHDHSSWANTNLRQKPVTFVSAGPSEPLKTLDEFLEEADRNEASEAVEDVGEVEIPGSPSLMDKSPGEPPAKESEDEFIGPDELEAAIQPDADIQDKDEFFFDLQGEQTHRQTFTERVHIPERPSSRGSSSSEEVILFKGRDTQRKLKPSPTLDLVQIQTEIRVVEQEIRTAQEPTASFEKATTTKRNTRRKRQSAMNDEDAIIADYIANMRENGETDDLLMALSGNRRDLGGTESEIEEDQGPDQVVEAPRAVDEAKSENDSDAEAPDELDDESASELDDETLAKLIAGHELGLDDVNFGDSSSDPDSSDKEKANRNRLEIDDDFDLMDWNRPSLRRKKGKGARAQINFNVSDSELERTLQMAWKNDRMKKSERKKHREQQRALGLLGKKANPEDLRVKYPQGMGMEQVAEELRTFLLNSDDTLALPPMDNHARKIIHDLANKFKIKSKSTGKADQRRPILYRTGRTLPYVDATFDQVFSRTTRRYLPRLDAKGKRAKRPPPGRSNAAAASLQDGEIVGGGAPELSVENRGRAMLEKMGWSSGTALGALHNKGILQPVTQAMKRSKAGLG